MTNEPNLAAAWDQGYRARRDEDPNGPGEDNPYRVPPLPELCHCGEPVTYGFDGDPTHHRGMCAYCDSVRCDAFPGACWE